MFAAQGVAAHAGVMECLRRAMLSDMPEALAIKLRASAVQMNRMFSGIVRDLERLQSNPLPLRPVPPSSTGPGAPPQGPNAPDAPQAVPAPDDAPRMDAAGEKPRAKRTRSGFAKAVSTARAAPAPDALNAAATQYPLPSHALDADELDDEGPEDIEIRPDGTPGTMAAYAPKPLPEVYVPGEPAIMIALATRPRPWRMVNVPASLAEPDQGTAGDDENLPLPVELPADPAAESQAARIGRGDERGPLDLRERIFTGDALARFASARFDPDAPVEQINFDDDNSTVELELISTGGDPAAEAERAALIAAHPEGKPIATFRYGSKKPADDASEDP